VPDVSPLQNVKFRVPLTFTAAKVFVNIFSRKYYFTNNLEITLAGAKFWTLCCVQHRGASGTAFVNTKIKNEPARQVGCKENFVQAALKFIERSQSLSLREFTMERYRVKPEEPQHERQSVPTGY